MRGPNKLIQLIFQCYLLSIYMSVEHTGGVPKFLKQFPFFVSSVIIFIVISYVHRPSYGVTLSLRAYRRRAHVSEVKVVLFPK